MRLTGLWWWIDRWRISAAFMDLTLEEQGAYRNLLDEATIRGGSLPNDDQVLAAACGDGTAWTRVRDAVMRRFQLEADAWQSADRHLWRRCSMNWPSIEAVKPRRPDVPIAMQRFVRARDHVCVWCGSEDQLEIDHIQRWRDGGDHSERNLRVLCRTCNRGRG